MFSVCIEGWRLAAKAFSNEREGYRRKQQYKIFLYTFLNPSFAKRWFSILHSPQYASIVEHRPRLYVKPFRVYMSGRWDKHRRMKAILDTCNFINNSRKLLMQSVTENEGVTIARFTMKDGAEASVVLGYEEQFRKEGELVLFLRCQQLGGKMAAASFSFELNDSEDWVCRIGCVQGHRNMDENIAKAAQKLMHGFRPKSFMIFLVQEFVRSLGVEAIYGAGQSIQAFNRKHFIHIPMLHTISQDYNNLWLEAGGTLEKDGWFRLPTVPVRKTLEEIKSHKRATYKRRYEMMDNVSFEIFNSI